MRVSLLDAPSVRRRMLLLALVASVIAACRTAEHPAGRVPAASASARPPVGRRVTGPIVFKDHLVFVRATLNETQEVGALLDTGANLEALDRSVAAALQLAPRRNTTVHGTAGTTSADVYPLERVSVFGLAVADLEATAYELGVPAPDGQRIGVILGYPFLKNFAVEVDYAARTLTLSTAPLPAARSVPFRLDDGIPCLAAELPAGVTAELRIDTGAALFETDDVYFNLTTAQLERLRRAGFDGQPAFKLGASGVGGTLQLDVYRLARATLGPLVLEQPYAIVQPPTGIFADPQKPGFVGHYTLDAQGRVIIDYLDGCLKFP